MHLIQLVSGRPWAISGDIAAHVRGLIAKDGIAGLRHFAELKRDVHAFDEDRPHAARGRSMQTPGTVAVIPVVGTMTQRGDVMNSMATRSTDQVAEDVRAAVMDPKIDAVVLEFDSPGGEVYGVPEAWLAIREAAKVKPIVAHANSVAASAAYYLYSAAVECWVTPSGELGSIGVYCLHVDASKAIEDAGEKWTFVHAGKYKVEGNPTEPLSDEARAKMQASVDRYYDMFTADVAKGRRVSLKRVVDGFGEGRMLGAQAAVEARMADQVGTLEQAIRRAGELGRDKRDGRASRAAVDVVAPEAAEQVPAPVAEAPAAPAVVAQATRDTDMQAVLDVEGPA